MAVIRETCLSSSESSLPDFAVSKLKVRCNNS